MEIKPPKKHDPFLRPTRPPAKAPIFIQVQPKKNPYPSHPEVQMRPPALPQKTGIKTQNPSQMPTSQLDFKMCPQSQAHFQHPDSKMQSNRPVPSPLTEHKTKREVEIIIEQPKAVPVKKTIHLHDNFRQGDILFGLDKPRDEVYQELRKKNLQYIVANQLNSPAVDLVMEAKNHERERKIAKLDKPCASHFHFLNKYETYLKRKPGKPIPLMAQTNPLLGAAYRRACKLLLINRDPNRTSRAHVFTKKIKWERVFIKDKKDFGVTNSEMRAAFRDYYRHGPNPHIFYYDEQGNLIENFWDKLKTNPAAAVPMQKYQESIRTKKRP